MKGVIFNIFEQFITANFGEATYETIYEKSLQDLSCKEPYVGPGTYPDSDLLTLVSNAVEKLNISLHTAVFSFGVFLFPHLAKKLETHVARYSHPKPFLMTLHGIIHAEVRKVMKDATPPSFECVDNGPSSLTMIYRSPRKLYPLVEGLLEGAARHFNVSMEVTREILNDEEGECRFEITFES
ncbi:MAG: heme NO-binding domain-containing protein [Bdellovibrionales bacterium]|nr:heme NO-binding domain-containing protein [Bdellovibrionales bacterium]